MFVVLVGAVLTLGLFLHAVDGQGEAPLSLFWAFRSGLVHTAVRQLRRGDGRGPRQGPGRGAPAERSNRVSSRRLRRPLVASERERPDNVEMIASTLLRKDDVVLVNDRRMIPADGEVIEGAASVDESAVTGEKRAVVRRKRRRPLGRHRRHARAVGLAGHSGQLAIRVRDSLDRMIGLVEVPNARRRPTRSPSAFCSRR